MLRRLPGESVLPLAVLAVMGIVTAAPAAPALVDVEEYGTAVAMSAGSFGLWAVALRRSWRVLAPVLAIVLFSAAVVLLHETGTATGYPFLLLVPVIAAALHGGRVELVTAVVVTTAALAVPTMFDQSGAARWGSVHQAAVWLVIAAGLGTLLQNLVRRVVDGAIRDPLTGLYNRRHFDEFVEVELARARRSGAPLAMVLMDLDHFKAYNDTHGHPAGDRLLTAAADAWTDQLRDGDVLARWGGEEFTVLLPDTSSSAAREIADRLRLATPGEQTCSVGVATWSSTDDHDTLIRRADDAMYRAKATGRDRVVVTSTSPSPTPSTSGPRGRG